MKRKNNLVKDLAIVITFLFIGMTFAPCINADISKQAAYPSKKHTQKLSEDEIFEQRYRNSPIRYRYMTEDGRIHTKTMSRWELILERAPYCEDPPFISTNGGDGNHTPIYIEGNNEFTTENGVTGGNGIEDDPYIIENWVIVYDGVAENGIYINNTDAYFVIRNCTVRSFSKDWHSGIKFNNVENGRIEDTEAFYNYIGIYIIDSEYIEIVNSTCHHNHGWYAAGIYCYQCSNIIISSCECHNMSGEAATGMDLWKVSYSIIEKSNIYDNDALWGIDFSSFTGHGEDPYTCMHNTIKDCIVYNNYGEGISLEGPRKNRYRKPAYNLVQRCEIFNNGAPWPGCDNGIPALSIAGLHNTIVEDCSYHHNGEGMDIQMCSNSIIRNCSIYNQSVPTNVMAVGIHISGFRLYNDWSWNVTLKHCDIFNNEIGLGVFESNQKVHHNNICNNSHFGILILYFPFAIFTGRINYNNIYGNGYDYEEYGRGLYTQRALLNARHNWWGTADGPGYDGPGSGDDFEHERSIVFIRPWATEPIPDAGVQ